MATAVRNTPQRLPGADEDPFHDPLMIGIGITFLVLALVIVALTGLIHWGVEYHSPPWSANSYPPSIVH